jgi:hypothetical protein
MAAASDIKDLALLYYIEDLLRQKKSIKRVKEQVSYNDTKLKLKLDAYKFGRMWSIAINRAVVQRDTQRRA